MRAQRWKRRKKLSFTNASLQVSIVHHWIIKIPLGTYKVRNEQLDQSCFTTRTSSGQFMAEECWDMPLTKVRLNHLKTSPKHAYIHTINSNPLQFVPTGQMAFAVEDSSHPAPPPSGCFRYLQQQQQPPKQLQKTNKEVQRALHLIGRITGSL